jgi:hypothetical protein
MKLEKITATPKSPDESFRFNGDPLNFKILDFWIWNQSDLLVNKNRGVLAEFIVKQALNIGNTSRVEWDAVDLITIDGISIEVKTSAYIQSWGQNDYSKIYFDIAPTYVLKEDNTITLDRQRQALIYIFCLLHHKDQESIDPMNLDQWTFYLVKTDTLNERLPNQKSMSLSTLEKKLDPIKCNFGGLEASFREMKDTLSPKSTDTEYLTSILGMSESIVEGMNTPIEECTDKPDWSI